MNEVLKALKERRSCKKYKPDMPEQALIDEVIEAGLYAPSAMGTQKTMMLVVTDKKVRDQLSDMNRRVGGWKEGFDPFYGAPVVIVVLAEKDWVNKVYDGSLVMENLMLAAHSMGLGSCWIHRAKEEFESEEGKELLKSLGIEGEWDGIGHCVLGYAEGEASTPAKRKENRVHYV